MVLYETNFVILETIENGTIAKWAWKAASGEMTDADYKEAFENCIKNVVKSDAKKVIGDATDLRFTITPELQEWSNVEMFTQMVANGVTQVGIIVSEEIFTQVAVEQLFDEDEAKSNFNQKYFSNLNDAINWCQA